MVYKSGLVLCSVLLLVISVAGQSTREFYWSVCNGDSFGEMNCRNGMASDENIGYTQGIFASVKGFFIIFAYGQNGEPTGLAQYVFQEKVGLYQTLPITAEAPISYLKQLGVYGDYKTSAISVALEKELITDSVIPITVSQGSVDNCDFGPRSRSLVIHGNEPWQLVGSNGRSICIQVENTTSFVPGVVRDVTELGFVDGPGNICAFIKGCPDSGTIENVVIPNSETTGVLRR